MTRKKPIKRSINNLSGETFHEILESLGKSVDAHKIISILPFINNYEKYPEPQTKDDFELLYDFVLNAFIKAGQSAHEGVFNRRWVHRDKRVIIIGYVDIMKKRISNNDILNPDLKVELERLIVFMSDIHFTNSIFYTAYERFLTTKDIYTTLVGLDLYSTSIYDIINGIEYAKYRLFLEKKLNVEKSSSKPNETKVLTTAQIEMLFKSFEEKGLITQDNYTKIGNAISVLTGKNAKAISEDFSYIGESMSKSVKYKQRSKRYLGENTSDQYGNLRQVISFLETIIYDFNIELKDMQDNDS
jgi:hypothetical protein